MSVHRLNLCMEFQGLGSKVLVSSSAVRRTSLFISSSIHPTYVAMGLPRGCRHPRLRSLRRRKLVLAKIISSITISLVLQ